MIRYLWMGLCLVRMLIGLIEQGMASTTWDIRLRMLNFGLKGIVVDWVAKDGLGALYREIRKNKGLSRPPQSPPPPSQDACRCLYRRPSLAISGFRGSGENGWEKRGPECYCIMSRHDSPKYNLTNLEQVEMWYVRARIRICVRMVCVYIHPDDLIRNPCFMLSAS
ncbi:hypothetical protein GGI42DRAFT_108321 [Trichoderma sp. SZMC 28013]